MKKIISRCYIILAIVLLTGFASNAQTTTGNATATNTNDTTMKTYLIERNIPNAGQLSADQLKAISQTSCGVLKQMGPKIQWIQSYVVGDKIFCVYKAQNEALLREHASKGGFPINTIYQVANIISPATAE